MTFFFDAIHPYVTKISHKIIFKIPFNVCIGIVVIPLLLWYHLVKGKFNLFIAGDALNISTIMTFIIAKLLMKPFILWEERWFWIKNMKASLIWPLIRLISLKSHALVVPGRKAKEFYIKLGIKEEKIFTAPNASLISISKSHRIKAKELRKKLNLKNKVVILYLGRVIKLKGVEILLRAVAKICSEGFNNVYLIIAGDVDDPHRVRLNRLCKELGLNNVYFAGFVSVDDRAVYLQLADIVTSIYEVWGLVINEAMSVGKPVISTTSGGGACELIKNGINGYIVPPGDVDALSKALKKLIQDSCLRRRFGRA